MKKVNLPCNVRINRFYRTYVDVPRRASDADIRKAVIRFIVEGQEAAIVDDVDLDIEEQDITAIEPDWEGADEHVSDTRRVVRCNLCGRWIGWEDDLKIDDVGDETCPYCGKSKYLMDLESGCNFDEKEIKKLWSMFGEINVNHETKRTEEPFMDFEAGTPVKDIWNWFDKKYPGGLHELIYGMDE